MRTNKFKNMGKINTPFSIAFEVKHKGRPQRHDPPKVFINGEHVGSIVYCDTLAAWKVDRLTLAGCELLEVIDWDPIDGYDTIAEVQKEIFNRLVD